MTETEFKLLQIAGNVGGYLVMCFYLIATMRGLVEKFLDRLILAIGENTNARIKGAEEMAKLSEKIDAMTKGSAK